MDLYPIELGTGRFIPRKKAPRPKKVSSAGDKTGASSLSKEAKEKIFQRDDYRCQCCSFRSEKYQQIHFKDNDSNNHDPDNLITACIFCQQCFNLGDVATMKSGTLIWMPEIEQHVINNIARAAYIARISQGPIADVARKILDLIMVRREEAQKRISTDDPYILGTVMNDYLSLKQYSLRMKRLDGIRLFPLDRRIIKEADLEFNQFPQILAYWRSKNGPFGGKPPQQWISLYQDALAQAA